MKPNLVVPMLVCRNPRAEISFCLASFTTRVLSQRVEKNGELVHATLLVNNSLLMVHDVSSHLASQPPPPDGSSGVVLYIYGDEVDATMMRAVAAGARVLMPAADQSWGHRVGRIIDPEGHVWNIASRLIDAPEPPPESRPAP